MSRMLSKMNLISVVQQLPKEDIETIQGYVEMIEEENQELKKQLHEASIEMQEMIEQDIECPSNCSKLKEILNTFLLANIPEIITQEEFNNIKKAIKQLLQENQKYKEVINKAIEFTNKKWGTWCTHHIEYMTELQNILKEVE